MDLYFECRAGISGDMSVGALLDLGASREKLEKALASMKLDNEFSYVISKKSVNAIMATDFDVILPAHHHHEHHHHEHRNLDDVNKIIDKADISENAKKLAKRFSKLLQKQKAKSMEKISKMCIFMRSARLIQ